MKTDLIIHGHFYQPPRQNPSTGLIDKEISGSRFLDYNQLISDSCYEANAHSRYLSFDGRILKIINNYAYMSFNFGPTLLSWFDENKPWILDRLVQADQMSLQRLGHGNAIAQGYNHSILPLSSPRSRLLQIDWALKDFERRFKRPSEGFWCPECAVDEQTLYSLASSGIKYVILSPFQARAARQDSQEAKKVIEGRIGWDESFAINIRDKSIAAFFYNPELASAVSFSHMLRSADSMYSRLLEIRKATPRLITYATDGEIYGHHEGYGDMAIAALIEKVESKPDFELTNFAAVLEKRPPRKEAFIHSPSSWSCGHGVERWRSDCGCSTGAKPGWNQKWRSPLRQGFEAVLERSEAIFDSSMARLIPGQYDGARLLTDYGSVLCHDISIQDLGRRWNVRQDDMTDFASLLEMRRCMENAFTSCGWFFNDISGLEPRKNIAFCLRAIELMERFSSEDLRGLLFSYLEKAQSNVEGNGKTIALRDSQTLKGFLEACLYFYVGSILHSGSIKYGDWKLVNLRGAFMTILNERSLETRNLEINETTSPWSLVVKDFDKSHVIRTKDIPERLMGTIALWIDEKLQRFDHRYLEDLATSLTVYGRLLGRSGFKSSDLFYSENCSICVKALKAFFDRPVENMGEFWVEHRQKLTIILEFIASKGRKSDIEAIEELANTQLERVAAWIADKEFTAFRIDCILEILALARANGMQPKLTGLQDAAYDAMLKGQLDEKDSFRLCQQLNLNLSLAARQAQGH